MYPLTDIYESYVPTFYPSKDGKSMENVVQNYNKQKKRQEMVEQKKYSKRFWVRKCSEKKQ